MFCFFFFFFEGRGDSRFSLLWGGVGGGGGGGDGGGGGGGVYSKPIPSFLHVLDYVISFMWQSCNSERTGSHINRVKTLECIGLLKDSFNSLVFGTFNNVPVQELDTPRLVSNWRSEGHMSGTTAGATEDDRSKVLKRVLEKKSNRFLLSKEAPLAPGTLADYIRRNDRA